MIMRRFDSGATRSAVDGKIEYVGYLSARVLKRFGRYMLRHRVQANGEQRAADNWKAGIPRCSYLDSLVRHTVDLWDAYDEGRGDTEETQDIACAILFNIQGYLHETLRAARDARADDTGVQSGAVDAAQAASDT